MKIVYSNELDTFTELNNKSSAVVIGNFDGVHIAHQRLLNEAINYAKNRGLASVVITFDPHPANIKRKVKKLITSHVDKLALLGQLGFDICFVIKFNEAFAATTPEEFFQKYLIDILHAKAIFTGDEFQFGKDKSGDTSVLSMLAKECNVFYKSVDSVIVNSEVVSSSGVRDAVLSGDIVKANRLLGRTISYTGKVIHGNNLGHTIGFPTANLDMDLKLIPKDGVYFGYTFVDDKRYAVMAYIGTRPTVTDSVELRFEAHLIGYSGDLYDTRLTVYIIKMIRDGQKFTSIDELKEQLINDSELVKRLYSKI